MISVLISFSIQRPMREECVTYFMGFLIFNKIKHTFKCNLNNMTFTLGLTFRSLSPINNSLHVKPLGCQKLDYLMQVRSLNWAQNFWNFTTSQLFIFLSIQISHYIIASSEMYKSTAWKLKQYFRVKFL